MMDISPLFNQPKFSDLKIQLSDDTIVHVHKAILSNGNEYFAKLCDPDSVFAEAGQDVIKLRDDDPIALGAVLRGIYDIPPRPDQDSEEPWRFWLSVYITADKYFAADTKSDAEFNFRDYVSDCENVDDICEMLEIIKRDLGHDKALTALADSLRKRHLHKLLKCYRFRAALHEWDIEALWELIDDLSVLAFAKNRS